MASNELLMKVSIQDDASKYFEQLSKATGASTKELKKMAENALQQSKKVNEALKDIDYNKLGISAKEAEKAVSESIDKQKAKVDELKNKMGKAYADITKALRNASMAIVSLGGVSTKSYMDLEMQIKKVQTISNDGFETISNGVRSLATKTGTSVNDLTEALYQVVSAIGDVEGKYEVLNISNKLAVGGFTSTTNAVDVLTTVINAYKMEATEAVKISDLLIQTQNKGKTTVDLLATSLGNVIPTASSVGVTFEALSTAMALLTSNGIGTAESATALNAMFTELSKSSTEASKAFKKAAGMGFMEYMKAGGDLGEALMLLKEQADKTGNSLLDLFNIRSFKGAQSIVDSISRYDIFKEAMQEASGTTEKAFEKMQESLSQQVKIIMANLKEIGISVGASLAPTVRDITEELKQIDFKKTFSKENIESIITTGKAIVSIYLALKSLNIAYTIGDKVIGNLSSITSSAMAGKVAVTALGTALTGLAVGGVVAGIGYLVTKYIAFKNEVEAVRKAMDISTGSWDQQTQAIERQREAITRAITAMKALKQTREYDKETKVDTKALETQYSELAKIRKEMVRLETYMQGMNPQTKAGIERLNEYRKKYQELQKQYKDFLLNIDKNLKIKNIEVEFSIKKEPLEKEIKELETLMNELSSGDIFRALNELGKDVDIKPLIEQYNELEKKGKNAAEQGLVLDEILKRLNEKIAVKKSIVFEINENEIAEIERIQNLKPEIPEEKIQKIKERFQEIKNDFDTKFKEAQTIDVKLNLIGETFKLTKGLGYVDDEIRNFMNNLVSGNTYYTGLIGKETPVKKTGSGLSEEVQKIMDEYKKAIANAPKLAEGLGISELDQVKSKLSDVEKAYKDLIGKGADGLANKLIPEMQKLRKEAEELNKEDKIRNLFKDYREDLEKFPKLAEIMGLDEEAQIKQKITNLQNLLKSLYDTNGKIIDTENFKKYEAQLEEEKKQLKIIEENNKLKEKEKTAVKDLINIMGTFGNDMIKLGQQLNSSLIESIGNITNSISIVANGMNQYKTSGGLGAITGMFSKGSGILGLVNGFSSLTGVMTAVSGIAGIGSLASSALSSLSGKDKKKKIEAANEENKKAFEESTKVLLTFTEAIKANITAINSYGNSMLGYATNNTTLAGIKKVEKNFDYYIKAMVASTKDFGTVTGLVKSKVKYKSYFKSKSVDKYEAQNIDEADILRAMGITNTNIANMDENQLRDFAEKLKTTGIGDLREKLGINFVDSNFEEWKEGVYEYVAQIDKLREEQEQLFRNSTLNAFEGIDVSSYKSLIQEYTQMFEDMGLNAEAYKDTIEEMAKNAQVLVTAMQDVRNSFVEALSSGEASDFSSSMSSYFKKILNNAAQVTYDVAYSSIDEYMTKEFEKISEKLIDMKKTGVLDFTGFWDDFNFNKILEANRITTNYEKVINDLRSQLESRGFGSSLIDSILPTTKFSERINEMKNMLSNAMSEALDNNSFASFEESLGNSIYESVKDSLIQAFVDSEVYKTYMNQFYNMDDIKEKLSQATSAQQGFDLMQDYLKDLEYELEKMGLNRGNTTSGNSTEDNTLGNSYYQDSGIECNITIVQHFSGVYGFDAMYDVAKQGAKEAIEEANKQGRILSS
ncbi:phage tail tape measure protein [Fusobacterium sp.]|uniref:phage tail tape measure protein n=1 Tax=Fusobacterium sp. TaxID=68766 RepID=UPI000E9F7AF4|nr:phage tail tape measure protein [Fusobacterium sp.]HBJ80184.1 phage tail tape measure protein [Fusobacterium sp.]